MPVACTFRLNSQPKSTLQCFGMGNFEAFSGHGVGRDNPRAVARADIGPLPPGRYYIVDRQSGGRLGWLYDYGRKYAYGTDRDQWFALWRAGSGDTTIINGVRRGEFRLHPIGPAGLSDGCITLTSPQGFSQLARFIRSQGATWPVPGSGIKAYGWVDVQ
ncbi:DUF2778 domain-containing protein [Paraburkholderia phenazinium]|uniref:DUF2778 domain-containing protein n=1 Tax=Paraburkholderia phenazinium TaxID=60549 RepID=UPI00158A9B4A|nr:DUF2778 domain-containing protein [Paraburkholderia phenazinium]